MGRPTPTAEERAKCWNSRDKYFKCMEDNSSAGNKDSICSNSFKEFAADCPPVWVKHFTRRRDWEKYKEEKMSQTQESSPGKDKTMGAS
ncbi:cytochrome c oxidase assembly factor 6 homolog [Styela clava]